jgi:hypothetical protein
MSSDSITFRWLKNLHVAIPAKAQSHFLRCEARTSLQNFSMASFSLYIPTEVSSLEQFSPLNSRDPLLCHVDLKSNPSCSPPISLLMIPAYTSLPRTTVWHVQNWSLPLTRLGRAHTWLMVAHVHLGWSLQEPVLNMIQVAYPTRGLPVTPRHSLKLPVTPDTVSKTVTQILTPCCYKKIIGVPSYAIVWLIKIRPTITPIPNVMLSMTYPETHPTTKLSRNNKEG